MPRPCVLAGKPASCAAGQSLYLDRLLVFTLLLLTLVVRVQAQSTASAPAAPLQVVDVPALTGKAHTRVVWMQMTGDGGRDFLSDRMVLAGYDSLDGQGARVILNKVTNYFRPQLTGDGSRIVYSNRTDNSIHVVNFDGSKDQQIATGGYAIEVWYDAATKTDWVYEQKQDRPGRMTDRAPVVRFKLDDPARKEEPVWDKTRVTFNHFQLSRDGKHAAIEWWPHCYIADVTTGKFTEFGRGCYPSISPDNTGVLWHMDGMHRSFIFTRVGSDDTWRVIMNAIPGFKDRKIHCPHWTNHPRYVLLTGPMGDGGPSDEKEDLAQVYLVRFSEDLTRVEAVARVSNQHAETLYPDAWIDGGDKATLDPAKLPTGSHANDPPPPPAAATWPGSTDALVFLWHNADKKAPNQFTDAAGVTHAYTVEPRAAVLFTPGNAMDLSTGSFIANADGQTLLDAVQKSGAITLELIYTPSVGPTGKAADATLLTWGKAGSPANLVLSVSRGQPAVFLTSRPSVTGRGVVAEWLKPITYPLIPDKPHHIIFSLRNGQAYLYVDGERAMSDADLACDLKLWQAGPVVFGSNVEGTGNLGAGAVESVAFYTRFFAGRESRNQAALVAPRLAAGSKLPDKLVVEATLAKTAKAPTLDDIGAYRRALVNYDYTVDKVIEGKFDGKSIRVAHWAILDGATVKALATRKVGDKVKLTLEKFSDRPLLETEWHDAGADNVPLYIDRTADKPAAAAASTVEFFRDAIAQCQLDEVTEFLKADPKLATTELTFRGRKYTPLELSAERTVLWRRDQPEVSAAIVAAGAPCDIFLAARAGLLDQVKKLVEADHSLLTAKDAKGYTALQRTHLTYGPNPAGEPVLDYLLKAGAPVDLFTAARLGMTDDVAGLLAKDPALAKTPLADGTAILHWAVRPLRKPESAPAIVKLLIEKGADLAAKDPNEDGMTPLHHAAGWGAGKDMITTLVEAKADLNALAGKPPYTPLDFAIDWAGDRQTIETLKKLGARESGNRSR